MELFSEIFVGTLILCYVYTHIPQGCFSGTVTISWPSASEGILKNKLPRSQGSWGQHGAHLGPIGPRWAPCCPHEPCYQGSHCLLTMEHKSTNCEMQAWVLWSVTHLPPACECHSCSAVTMKNWCHLYMLPQPIMHCPKIRAISQIQVLQAACHEPEGIITDWPRFYAVLNIKLYAFPFMLNIPTLWYLEISVMYP